MSTLQKLIDLLGLPPSATEADVRSAYRKKALEFHPDKGGDPERMKELNRLMDEFRHSQSLFCDETLDSDSDDGDSPGPSQRTSTPEPGTGKDSGHGTFEPEVAESSQASFGTPPKRGPPHIDLPASIEACLLTAKSVQSCPDAHLIITTCNKLQNLRPQLMTNFTTRGHIQAVWDSSYALFVILMERPTRVSTVGNFCKKHCTVSLCIVRGIKKNGVGALLRAMQEHPAIDVEQAIFPDDGPDEKQFNQALLNGYAISLDCTDALLLLAVYKRLARPVEACPDCAKERETAKRQRTSHLEDHPAHQKNAALFLGLRDQKRVCQCAVDGVLAEKRFKQATMTRNDRFTERLKETLKGIDKILHEDTETIDQYVAAILMLNMLVPRVTDIADILETMVRNPPKKRYYIFRGPVNTGKTTVAAAILNLCTGASLNVNGTPERLQFELGCAIDQYMVLFEDVKGQSRKEGSGLPTGLGMMNLDNLRDHLEGSVPVNLERKHQNKVSQVFPPGLITMNDYYIPQTVLARTRAVVEFHHNDGFARAVANNPDVVEARILTKAETLLALLLINRESEERLSKQVRLDFETTIDCLKFEVEQRIWKYLYNLHAGLPYDHED
uniref:Large T antigen n=1 Tax=Gammapolyomavirus pypyrrhula TaxID=1891751 RepID=A0A2I6RKC0_9POLY|nr:putative large T antigen [Gammapolyomavirus pypyrrhula]AUN86672.1 putative large T antigen [Gammapolyomavirus pypyrrhula]